MYLRPKTKRRLVVLLSCAALIFGSAVALVGIQLHRIEVRRQQDRALAIDAYDKQDYQTAMRWFRRYLLHSGDDAEALYDYADCRLHVPGPDYGYLIEAKSIFNRYLELRPDDLMAQHQLLKIYRDLGYDDDAFALALTIIKDHADDLPALDAQIHSLIVQSKYEQALDLSQKTNELAPLDLQEQITTLQLMRALRRPPQQMIDRVEALMKSNPPDARLDLLRAAAADLAGNAADTIQWLRSATALSPNDPQIVLEAARLFQAHGDTADARQCLDQLAQNLAISSASRVQIAQLLVGQSEYEDAIRVLEFDRRSDSDVNHNLLLARLYATVDRSDDAAQLYGQMLETLSASDAVKQPAAWFYASHGDIAKGRALLAHCDDPTILAEFEEDFGSDKTAFSQYTNATRLAPHSARSWMALAGFELRAGDFAAAVKTAEQGTHIAADNAELNAMMARAQMLEKLPLGDDLLPVTAALSVDPNNAAAVQTLGVLADVRTRQSAGPDPVLRLATIVQSDPQFLPAQSALAEQYVSAGRVTEAQQIAEKAGHEAFILPDAGSIEALIDLARIQARTGRPDQAAVTLARLNAILKVSPEITQNARRRMDEAQALVKGPAPQGSSVTEMK
jgi:tetratricopeptide (TPR) repeat protein